jgi:hypothetical protein
VNEYYAKKLQQGLEYQDYVFEKLYDVGIATIAYSSKKYQNTKGENKAGFEIKFDDRLKSTGNLYIEIAEKSHPANKDFVPSGIYRNDNTWLYMIGNYDTIFIFDKKRLRKICDGKYYKKIGGRFIDSVPTSRGFTLPAKYAEEELAIKVIKFNTS